MTSKYDEDIQETLEDIKEDGVTVEYYSEVPPLFGRGVNQDNRITVRHYVDVIFDDEYRRRDGGGARPSNQFEAWMGAVPFKPKPGDKLVTPMGKSYPIDQVRAIEPDGYPIIYQLRGIDG